MSSREERIVLCDISGKLARFAKVPGDSEERCCFIEICGHLCGRNKKKEMENKQK